MVLTINELKFTPAEIQQLVQQNHGLSVSEQRAFELSEVSDGWITALLLMGYQAGWRELIEGAISAPDSPGGGIPATRPQMTSLPFRLSLRTNDSTSGPATASMMTS